MPEAARQTDMHSGCPAKSCRGGGPILTNVSPNVYIDGLRAAFVGSLCQCGNHPNDPIVKGSRTVTINGKPAARRGDPTAHKGKIMTGSSTVIIGG